MKKKAAILILTLSMTFSLASCGSEELANVSTSDVASVVQSVEDAIESASQESESAVDETEEEPESESESESEESESQAEEQESSEAPLEETTEAEAASEEAVESSEESPAEPEVPAESETPAYTFNDASGVKYAKANVNVRDVPSKEGSKVGSLSTNDKVEFTGICNETGWYRFTMNGKDAYVSGNYLVSEKVAVATPTPAPVDNSGTQVADNGNSSGTQVADNSGSGNGSGSTPAPADNGNSTASAPVDTNSSASAPEGGNTQVADNDSEQGGSSDVSWELIGDVEGGKIYQGSDGSQMSISNSGVVDITPADRIGGGDGFDWGEPTAEDLELDRLAHKSVNGEELTAEERAWLTEHGYN